jgi:hypothetical protein
MRPLAFFTLVACGPSAPLSAEVAPEALRAARPAAVLTGVGHETFFGTSVASAGDVDADGYDDVVVGAPTDITTGAAMVFLGSAAGLSTTAATTMSEMWDPSGYEVFGTSVDGAGDVNGDGYADVIVGGPTLFGTPGHAFVYDGGPAGLSAVAASDLTVAGTYSMGSVVAGLGDANGDGYDDVVVGNASYCNCGAGGGISYPPSAYVYYGSAAGLPAAPSLTLAGTLANGAGEHLARAGDLDGDGYADLALGAANTDANVGAVWIFYGSPAGYAASPDLVLHGDPANTYSFGTRVFGVGDVDGDGFDDLVATDNHGTASLYLGGAGGLSAVPAQSLATASYAGVFGVGDVTADGYDDVVVGDPTAANGGTFCLYAGSSAGIDTASCIMRAHGAHTWDALGSWAAAGGDVDGDGRLEMLVSAPSWGAHPSPLRGKIGRVYLYEGK